MRLPQLETELTPTRRANTKASLLGCIKRLSSLVTMDAPDVVVCNEIVILCRRAMLLYGKYYWQAWGEWMLRTARISSDLCPTCQWEYFTEDECPQCQRDGNEYVDHYFNEAGL